MASPKALRTDVHEVEVAPNSWHFWEAPLGPGALGGRLPHALGGTRTTAASDRRHGLSPAGGAVSVALRGCSRELREKGKTRARGKDPSGLCLCVCGLMEATSSQEHWVSRGYPRRSAQVKAGASCSVSGSPGDCHFVEHRDTK